MRSLFVGVGLAGCLAALTPALVHAQGAGNYPSKPILVILPTPPGGAGEAEARIWSNKLAENLGQPFVMEFKPGAGTTIGLAQVAKANPDGYTLCINTVNMPLAPLRYPDLPFDTIKSFEHISLLNKRTSALLVSTQLPIRNIKEYIAYARAHPGEINFQAAGEGSIDHIMGIWLMAATNTQVTFIHYKASGSAYVDLMAGRLHMINVSYSLTGAGYPALVGSGKARNIGTTAMQRTPLAPDVPTLNEQGVTDFESSSFLGLLAPARTPAAIVNRLNAEVVKISKLPETIEKLGKGSIIVANSPAEYRKFLQDQTERFRKLAQDYNINMKGED